MSNARILLVEDEESLLTAVKMNLELEGYEVVTATTGSQAVKKFKAQRFNLVILDIMLPEMDGYKVSQSIRTMNADLPILFLTAKDTSEDKVAGFKAGGDDYLTKPFNLEELMLRIKVLVRHSLRAMTHGHSSNIYRFGDGNEINFSTFMIRGYKNKKREITKKEAALLRLLIDKKNQVVSREEILQTVWGYDVYPSTRTIDNFILLLRKHFEKDQKNPQHFNSVHGVGYRFDE